MPELVGIFGDREHYTLTADDVEHLRRGNSVVLNESVEVDFTAEFWDKLGVPSPDVQRERERAEAEADEADRQAEQRERERMERDRNSPGPSFLP